MYLYFVRHAHAIPRETEGVADEDRPLTDKGHEQTKLVAQAMNRLGIQPDLILTSAYKRARETADGLAQHLSQSDVPVREHKRLLPGSPTKKLARHLIGAEGNHVVIVGHEPDLSEHLAWMIGSKKAMIKLGKAAVACVECEPAPGRGMATLHWLITPALMADLTEAKPTVTV